jgi:hypothetical protein
MLGPSEAGLSRERDAMDSSGVSSKRSKGGGDAASEETTIAERLDALSSALASSEASASKRQVPTTESLAVLLEHSLQSSDDVLLEECLAVTDVEVSGRPPPPCCQSCRWPLSGTCRCRRL